MILRERLQSLGYRGGAGPPHAEVRLGELATALGGQAIENAYGEVVLIEDLFAVPTPRTHPDAALLGRLGLDALPATARSSLCFFDTETTGLNSGAGNQVFLVAMAWWRGNALLLRQYLLADPAMEQAFLAEVSDDLASSRAFVSYNGRAFDAPVLESRMVMARRPAAVLRKPHLDLLHPVRRIFKARLGSCTLGNVEALVLGRDRDEDVPGFLIPEIYFTFLRRRDPELLRGVLAHNRQDVISLGLLLDHLCSGLVCCDGWHPLDRLGMARMLEVGGEGSSALAAYRALWAESEVGWGGQPWPGAWTPVEAAYVAGLRLATLCRRLGLSDEAEGVLSSLWRRYPAPWEAGILLAKHLEHRRRDAPAALVVVLAAVDALESLPGRGDKQEVWLADLRYRRRRLERKTAA